MTLADKLQIVENSDKSEKNVTCKYCSQDLMEIGNILFMGVEFNNSASRKEFYRCRCGHLFVMNYSIFDAQGHINSMIFEGSDFNDLESSWEILWGRDENQKKSISEHLENCKKCREKRDENILNDAWLSSVFAQARRISNL